jgi:hypothetical protein
MRLRLLLVVAIALVVLALPAAASAQTPAQDVYDPKDLKVQGSDAGGVPFTGLDIAVVVLAGAALLGTGVAIRRAARSD